MNDNVVFLRTITARTTKTDQVLDTKSHSNEIYLFIEMCENDSF